MVVGRQTLKAAVCDAAINRGMFLMRDCFPTLRGALLAAAFLLITGCAPAMSNKPDSTEHQTTSSMFPLRFVNHAFQVFCYNTVRCHAIYNDFNFTPYKADERPSPAPPSEDYRDHWPFASYAGIPNFPLPAEVNWTSLDGVAHTAQVDIGAIFKNERVLYQVPDNQIPDGSWGGEPGIFLEINDRTISVYMKAFIATKAEQIPSNKDSNFRDDVILAWTHTY